MGKKTVVLGMSGGVDSSVSAHLLLKQGYRVIGLFMKNWHECPEKDEADVATVCHQLGIPHYTVTLAEAYWDEVFSQFLREIKQGLTPNPDVLCNEKIKFHHFFQKALELGADFIATGHFCRTEGGYLLRGSDPAKDQSYFLYRVSSEALAKTLFPVGALVKKEVRSLARKLGLSTADKRDSTGICFIGKRPFRAFLKTYLATQPGDIVDLEGRVIGQHEGAYFYTIGQRKGLHIGSGDGPWFVAHKDLVQNRLVVVQGEAHPALFSSSLTFHSPHWIDAPLSSSFHCTAKIRYRTADLSCTVSESGVCFETPAWGVTPGQSIVFYKGEKCLGGGFIHK